VKNYGRKSRGGRANKKILSANCATKILINQLIGKTQAQIAQVKFLIGKAHAQIAH